jgi:hypothetical protein
MVFEDVEFLDEVHGHAAAEVLRPEVVDHLHVVRYKPHSRHARVRVLHGILLRFIADGVLGIFVVLFYLTGLLGDGGKRCGRWEL